MGQRALGVAVVVDGLANSGNVAAVMRSAEGLGYLRMDMVKGSQPYNGTLAQIEQELIPKIGGLVAAQEKGRKRRGRFDRFGSGRGTRG